MPQRNTPLARSFMIDMICNEGASLDQVNDAIGADGSKISESSHASIKRTCRDFEKYPELKREWITNPLDGAGYKELLEKYKMKFPGR